MAKKNNPGGPRRIRVFIAYRQGLTEGTPCAEWVDRNLRGQQIDLGHGRQGVLDPYFDTRAPAVSDWVAKWRLDLRIARAMILVCTPGARHRRQGRDWLHDEIDWWVRNRRRFGPIVIEASSEQGSCVPEAVTRRWPFTQRLGWKSDDTEASLTSTVERIRDGIGLSIAGIDDQELVRLRWRNRSLLAAGILLVTLVIGIALTMREASDSQKVADARALVQQAALVSADTQSGLTRSTLLAIASIDLAPTPEATEILASNLFRSQKPLWVRRMDPAQVAISDDGEVMALSEGHDPITTFLVRTQTGEPTGFRTPNTDRGVLSLSPTGRFLATKGNPLEIWDTVANRVAAPFPDGARFDAVFFDDKETVVAAVSRSTESVRYMSLASRQLYPSADSAFYVLMAADGNVVLFRGAEHTLAVRSLADDRLTELASDVEWSHAPVLSPDGRSFAILAGRRLRVWDLSDLTKPRCDVELPYQSSSLFFSGDRRRLLLLNSGTAVGMIRLDSSCATDEPPSGLASLGYWLVRGDGQYVFSSSSPFLLRLDVFDATELSQSAVGGFDKSSGGRFTWSRRSNLGFSQSAAGTVAAWDLQNGVRYFEHSGRPVAGIDDYLIESGTHELVAHDLATDRRLPIVSVPGYQITPPMAHARFAHRAAIGDGKRVIVNDFPAGRPAKFDFDGTVLALALSPNGNQLLVAVEPGALYLRDLRANTSHRLDAPELRGLEFYNSGIRLVVSDRGGAVLLGCDAVLKCNATSYEPHSGVVIQRPLAGAVNDAVITGDGDLIAISDSAGLALLETSSALKLTRVPLARSIASLAFDRTGKFLAVTGADGLLVFDAATRKLLHRSRAGGVPWFRPDGRTVTLAQEQSDGNLVAVSNRTWEPRALRDEACERINLLLEASQEYDLIDRPVGVDCTSTLDPFGVPEQEPQQTQVKSPPPGVDPRLGEWLNTDAESELPKRLVIRQDGDAITIGQCGYTSGCTTEPLSKFFSPGASGVQIDRTLEVQSDGRLMYRVEARVTSYAQESRAFYKRAPEAVPAR